MPCAEPTEHASQRLFLALWPSPEQADALMAWVRDAHQACGGRMMRQDTLHLTLAFLGNTETDRVDVLQQACTSWTARVGAISLNQYGRFIKPRVVWAGPDDTSELAWLHRLHDDLWCRLEGLGWQRPASPFRPHISLLRKANVESLPVLRHAPLRWVPEQCVLVASRPEPDGSRYQVLARMPLQHLSDL